MTYPRIIQGGMGVAVSGWPLARAVSLTGQMGVVSGTALDLVLARRLQLGDLGGHVRRALDHFPIPEMATRIREKYFIAGGKAAGAAFKSKPMPNIKPSKALLELIIVANFVEVWLAKEGHSGLVGINLLEKIQVPTLPSLFGAMLADVDFVLMGAGIPRNIPPALDRFAELQPADLPIDVAGALPGEVFNQHFDPIEFREFGITSLKRPKFLAIVSSSALANMLAKKCTGEVNGFVIEGPTAGGHNAPPRGAMTIDENGEPIYGPRDAPDLAQFRELGLPFWMAGSYGSASGLKAALAEGAQGVQVGTAFAFCEESGIVPEFKTEVLCMSAAHKLKVFTDPLASPTGYPFKVVQLPETAAEQPVYERRNRICDFGYLRTPYRTEKGDIGYRCAAEPIDDYVKKGGEIGECSGRKCVCNGLATTIGLGNVREEGLEPALVTAGDRAETVAQFLEPGKDSYTAADVIRKLLGE